MVICASLIQRFAPQLRLSCSRRCRWAGHKRLEQRSLVRFPVYTNRDHRLVTQPAAAACFSVCMVRPGVQRFVVVSTLSCKMPRRLVIQRSGRGAHRPSAGSHPYPLGSGFALTVGAESWKYRSYSGILQLGRNAPAPGAEGARCPP
jgi:hypothetical protein